MEKRLLLILGFVLATMLAHADPFLMPEDDDKLSIYPNPASSYVEIELSSESLVQPKIRIVDLTGKIVRKYENEFLLIGDKHKAYLELGGLRSGIYFVKVVQGKKIYTKKLVVS